MKKTVLQIVFVLSCVYSSYSQIADKSVFETLDSACSKIGISPGHDFWLPIDYTNPQKHLLKCVKATLENNLYSFQLADDFFKAGDAMPGNGELQLFRLITERMEFKNFQPVEFNSIMPKEAQKEVFGDDTQKISSIVNSLVLQDFMAMMLQAQNSLDGDPLLRSKVDYYYLVENTDSVFIYSSDASGATPIDTRKSELESLEFIKKYFSKTDFFDQSRLINIGLSVYLRTVELARKLKQSNFLNQVKTLEIETPFGKIAIGGKEDNTYVGDYILIVDVGGNDVYNLSNINKYNSQAYKTRVIVDLSGDDKYLGGNYSLGGAYFGNSILLDFAGNDLYSGGDVSIGAAMFGVGIVHDYAGNDMYRSGSLSQGAAAFGVGLLIDDGGNDQYSAVSYSQGFGYTKGFGMIRDGYGNDTYSSIASNVDVLRYSARYLNFNQGAACGVRPVAAGGLGFIFDYAGNDIYNADIYGQASSYWFSFAAIVDKEGDDRYSAHQYAQGAGIHLSSAVLADLSGNDVYYAYGVSLGCGHDLGFGALLDKSGNDAYTAGDLSIGSGNANAISLFLDIQGNDIYQSFNSANTFGFSDYRRFYGFFGIFVDGNGDDKYPSHKRNGYSSYKSFIGMFDDEPSKPETKAENVNNSKPETINPNSLPFSIDSLLPYASALLLSHQKYVVPAREKIIAYGIDSLPSLMPYLDTELPRERLAIEIILDKICQKDSAKVGKILVDSLSSSNFRTIAMCANTIGKNKITLAANYFLQSLKSTQARIRAISAETIGHIGRKDLADSLLPVLEDPDPFVRARAASAIAELNPDSLFQLLNTAISDTFFLVSLNTLLGIQKYVKCDYKLLKTVYSQSTSNIWKLKIPIIFSAFELNNADQKHFAQLLQGFPNGIRQRAYLGMFQANTEDMKQLLDYSIKFEKEPDLKIFLDKMIKGYDE